MKKKIRVRVPLLVYDVLIYIINCIFFFGIYSHSMEGMSLTTFLKYAIPITLILLSRIAWNIYGQVWRYGGVQSYLRLIIADGMAGLAYYLIDRIPFFERQTFVFIFSFFCSNLVICLSMRMAYRFFYKCAVKDTPYTKMFCKILSFFTREDIRPNLMDSTQRIKVAILGAGRMGVALADDLKTSLNSVYTPVVFIDANKDKAGREINNIHIISTDNANAETLRYYGVQEIVLAVPDVEPEEKMNLYNHFHKMGYKVKVYDLPKLDDAGNKKRVLCEVDPSELLFRPQIYIPNDKTKEYYHDKVILITGGGGSIGSELCRQVAKFDPKKLIILDVYENCAYDIQQDLRMKYKDTLDLHVEIVSVCNREGLRRVFETYMPDIVIHAAAHKHVPLMEHNCIEAVENNVFGTKNVVELSEEYGVTRMMMVSTDKAVNPTNVMGATKRMCEMIVMAHARNNRETGRYRTTFSATRFGNVLGSAGSVIPLFKKQIQRGGPVTITDKRIIRYFMTIPEASQLVLESGVMAENGELFVLDMGKPVKILDLAENMIRLSGLEPNKDIEIVETGLRPGEKLYEELLVKTEELDKTENNLIFIERETPIAMNELDEKLDKLKAAAQTSSDDAMRETLKRVVPTFHSPEEVNNKIK